MATKQHVITLTNAERTELEKVARSTHRSVREKKRARILLMADANRSREEGGSCKDIEIAPRVRCALVTVAKVRRRACERGVVETLARREQVKRKVRKLDGAQEAQLIAVACSTPPEGAARWTLKLLRGRLIELEVVESIGVETIRLVLKKTTLSPG